MKIAIGNDHAATELKFVIMDYLKELADRCSLYKINQLHLYFEHTFLFDGLSEVWRDDTPLTAQDILEFDGIVQKEGKCFETDIPNESVMININIDRIR